MATKKTEVAPELQPEVVAEAPKPKTYDEMTVSEKLAYDAELVDLFVEFDAFAREDSILVGMNGKNWLLACGKENRVPRYVAAEYKRGVRAASMAAMAAKQLQDQAKAEAAACNL